MQILGAVETAEKSFEKFADFLAIATPIRECPMVRIFMEDSLRNFPLERYRPTSAHHIGVPIVLMPLIDRLLIILI